ncbi:MAG: hypothetical protein ACOYOA_04860 [Saprospiraceae bacterium]
MPLRNDFPAAGSDYLGGVSNGWEYKTSFSGSTLEKSFEMIKIFLQEEGFGDIPLPANARELRLFKKIKRNSQLSIFGETGYIHNPIKVLFHPNEKRSTSLTLCVYNDKEVNHLLRFYGLV